VKKSTDKGSQEKSVGRKPGARQLSGKSKKPKAGQKTAKTVKHQGESDKLTAAQQAVGMFLRTTREAQKLTQEQVSAMTKGESWQLSRAAISAIERGQNFPGMEAMLAISNVLFVDPKELIERARLSTVVPLDITNVTYEELDKQATQYFWAGDFRKALSVYDALLEKVTLESPENEAELAERVAKLEVRRATALKRAGALLAAISTAERAIALSIHLPEVQVQAYIVLAGLQAQRGHLPLARDAAQRSIELSNLGADDRTKGWAWNVRAKVYYMSRAFEEAKLAYIESRRLAKISGDEKHLTHTEGNIGLCWWEQGHVSEARKWIMRAMEHARRQKQPALEAAWVIELGRIALQAHRLEEAEKYARAALKIGRPLEHNLTIFRAEWLLHLIVKEADPDNGDRHRLHYLRKLFLHLDQYEGIEEIQEFKRTALRSLAVDARK
jgi:transcriptional regulator with XRE-family HTH domain